MHHVVGREMMNQLSLSPDEIEACFSAFNDEKTNKVSSEIFARLLSELEKVLNNKIIPFKVKFREYSITTMAHKKKINP